MALFEAAIRTSYLYNVTVSGNRADVNEDDTGDGGGIYSTGSVYLYNNILAENSDGSSQFVHPDCSFDTFLSGALGAAQYNLVGDDTGCEGLFDDDPGNDIEGNLVGLDPELAALGDYGGPTLTHALYRPSPARDAGDPDGCLDADGDPLTVDQRGEPRPESAGGRCDMGAVEYAPPVISAGVAPATVIEDGGAALTVTFTRTVNTMDVTTATFDVGGTATFNADYVQSGADSFDGNSGSLSFGGGVVTQTMLITPTVDHIVEPDETVVITLIASPAYQLGTAHTATGTIMDDDSAGIEVDPNAGLITTEAGGSDTFTVTLQSEPVDNVVVALSSNDPGEGTVSPTELAFDATNWQTPQVVTVTGMDDDEDDGDQSYTVVTSVSSDDNVYDGIETSDVSATNLDDDEVYSLYMPVVFSQSAGPPDLIVDSVSTDEDEITVVIANVGEGPVFDAFWVDAYIDPHTPPTGVNDVWWRVGEEGLVWGVTEDALPLGSGETLTLT